MSLKNMGLSTATEEQPAFLGVTHECAFQYCSVIFQLKIVGKSSINIGRVNKKPFFSI